MTPVSIRMGDAEFAALRAHLVRPGSDIEEAAFLFARFHRGEADDAFEVIEWAPVETAGFVTRSAYYLELTDATLAAAIKRAHDLDACLIEAHSHPTQERLCFSHSDVAGFEDCVPHALWRLKRRPYAAIVMGAGGFDGLAWTEGEFTARRPIASIVTPGQTVPASGRTHPRWEELHAHRPL